MREEETSMDYNIVPANRNRDERKAVEAPAAAPSAEIYNLCSSWTKVEIYPGMQVYYDWKNRLFSFSPVLDMMQFVTLMNQISTSKKSTRLSFEDINLKIDQIEQQIKS